MNRRFKVYGQGINSEFKYTGNYDDSPFFGYLSCDEVIRLVSRLPPYPYQASEEELCPPTITVLDKSGNGLSISATTEIGKYDIFYVGDKSGDVFQSFLIVSCYCFVVCLYKSFSGIPGKTIKPLEKPTISLSDYIRKAYTLFALSMFL